MGAHSDCGRAAVWAVPGLGSGGDPTHPLTWGPAGVAGSMGWGPVSGTALRCRVARAPELGGGWPYGRPPFLTSGGCCPSGDSTLHGRVDGQGSGSPTPKTKKKKKAPWLASVASLAQVSVRGTRHGP